MLLNINWSYILFDLFDIQHILILRIFNVNYCFIQINVALEDNNRIIEKSRISWKDSIRMGKEYSIDESCINLLGDNNFPDLNEVNEGSVTNQSMINNGGIVETKKDKKAYDIECFEDKAYYSLLLKV